MIFENRLERSAKVFILFIYFAWKYLGGVRIFYYFTWLQTVGWAFFFFFFQVAITCQRFVNVFLPKKRIVNKERQKSETLKYDII